jgi:hypothetical protein
MPVYPHCPNDCFPKGRSRRVGWRCALSCGRKPTMKTIQVVLDARLLRAAGLAEKRHKMNRSALIRQALQRHLKRFRELELEEQDRRGFMARPQDGEEFRPGRNLQRGRNVESRRCVSLQTRVSRNSVRFCCLRDSDQASCVRHRRTDQFDHSWRAFRSHSGY